MTDTNELTGRELAVACAEAMGWTATPGDHHMLAWLHDRGVVHTASSRRVCEVCHMRFGGMGMTPAEGQEWIRGGNLTEALQRLVVAVAKRGSKSKETP